MNFPMYFSFATRQLAKSVAITGNFHLLYYGISKENIVDTSSDPVGLWTQDAKLNKDWARTATYKAFCEALSGN